MKCPSCNDRDLRPTKLHHGLPAYSCAKCHGVLIDLLTYRHWSETQQGDDEPVHGEGETASLVEGNSHALVCTKCSHIMTKFSISGETANKVDVCATCHEAWLDAGEWQLLGALRLQGKLAEIVTEPWQKAVRAQTVAAMRDERLQALFGDDLSRLRDLRDWLAEHPAKEQALRYLRSEVTDD
jgi:Zn-finger nucleic acid-binding protein